MIISLHRKRRVCSRCSWVAVAALLGLAGLPAIRAADEPAKTVSVTIDYGDGSEKRFTAISWRDEMTVQDAMTAVEKHPRGVKLESRGSGSTALLLKIDDLKNEGGGGRGWMYRVNGKLGDKSYGLFALRPGDAVLWKFEKYR